MQFSAFVFLAAIMGMALLPAQSILAQTSGQTAGVMYASESSPLKQMSKGAGVHDLHCDEGMQLVFKASNWRPACVNVSSVDVLQKWGWASSVQPTDENLMSMLTDYVASHPMISEEQTGDVSIEEGVSIEGSTNTGGNETQTQNFTVNLSEAMEMGAQ